MLHILGKLYLLVRRATTRTAGRGANPGGSLDEFFTTARRTLSRYHHLGVVTQASSLAVP